LKTFTTILVSVLRSHTLSVQKLVAIVILCIKHLEIMNDPLAERYYNIIKEKVKEDYYWQKKVENFIKTGSYYDK